MIEPKANTNFHSVAGADLYESKDSQFKEYRRKWKDNPESLFAGEFPLFIDIEATSLCNLKCPFCATTYRGSLVKKGFIEFDVVKKIIDEGAEHGLYGAKFNLRGEPLLHNEIHKFVAYAKKKGLIDVYYNTNGMLLDDDNVRKVIDSRLDRISVSAEGYRSDAYERYRVGGNFELLVQNIKRLQDLKRKLGIDKPRVRIQTVMLPEISADFEKYKNFWSKYADEVAYLDYKDMKDKKMGVVYPWACPQLWQRMAVFWDGTILPCNHDDDACNSLGNIKETTISDAWKSVKLNRMRNEHKEGKAHTIGACDGCYLRDSEIGKLRSL
jgi:Predicted Fe-S oxidoreductases